jgi:GDP-4-dehydro-6-deoxy-D-mannose reductase
MAVWLVTGGTGFLGKHLLAVLEARRPAGVELALLGRRRPRDHRRGTAFLTADLNDPAAVHSAITAAAPAVVFHLAGQTPPAAPEAFYRGNTLATVHLLDALHALGRRTRVVLAGSAAELGPIEASDLPAGEGHACRPADSYGLSKVLATAAGMAARPPLEVLVARIFNPIGPGLPCSQAFGRFAALLAEPGSDPIRLRVGDLDARRDFVDVRDVARALLALAEHGEQGTVYHVGTGGSQRVGDGLEHLIRLCGREVEVVPNPAHGGGRGPSDSRADIRRITQATGWAPAISWPQSLQDLWDASRDGVAEDCSRRVGGQFGL